MPYDDGCRGSEAFFAAVVIGGATLNHRRKVPHPEYWKFRQKRGPLEGVFQFPDVPGLWMREEGTHRPLADLEAFAAPCMDLGL